MSLMSDRRCSPLRLIRSSDSRARGLMFSFGDVWRRSAKPRMALSGVRSSWLIEARNSVFTLFARASDSPCSASMMLFSRRRSCVQALCRPPASWRAASRTISSRSAGSGLLPAMSTVPADSSPTATGWARSQRIGTFATPRSSVGGVEPKSSSCEDDRLPALHDRPRQPVRAEHRVIEGAPVGRDRADRDHPVRPVEQVYDADLRPREADEPGEPGLGERFHVERSSARARTRRTPASPRRARPGSRSPPAAPRASARARPGSRGGSRPSR